MRSNGLMATTVLIAVFLVAGTAGAVDFGQKSIDAATVYKDLPGVKPYVPDYARSDSPPACSKELVPVERHWLNNGRMEVVYSCEKDGIVIQSSHPPRARDWIPGITDQPAE